MKFRAVFHHQLTRAMPAIRSHLPSLSVYSPRLRPCRQTAWRGLWIQSGPSVSSIPCPEIQHRQIGGLTFVQRSARKAETLARMIDHQAEQPLQRQDAGFHQLCVECGETRFPARPRPSGYAVIRPPFSSSVCGAWSVAIISIVPSSRPSISASRSACGADGRVHLEASVLLQIFVGQSSR